jgi:hypothetical protein
MKRWFLRILALAALVGLVFGGYVSYSPVGDEAPHPFNHDRNAVWLEHRWLEKESSEEEIGQLLALLRARGVTYVYPHLIPFDPAGRLPKHSREQMRRFLAVGRQVAPDIKILPWVGGVRTGYKRMRPGTMNLADVVQRQTVVAECRGLMDEGFHGIHLNIEPVDDGNLELLALLRALRSALGREGILSLSATRPGPFRLPMAPNFFWTRGYYTRIADLTDQLVVMTYDTAIPTSSLYRRYVAYVASSITSSVVASRSRTRVMVGVPTYDETGLMHRAGVETPENALAGIVVGLRGLGGGGTFEGVALYAGWTTDDREWAVYERIWRGRKD